MGLRKINHTNEKGFSLVELLVVSVLLSILASILYGSITGIMQGRSLVRGQLETVRVSQYIIEKIGRELSSAIAIPLQIQGATNPTNTNRAGFSRGRAVAELENAKSSFGDKDSLTFISSQSSQLLKGSNSNFGSIQINYRLEEGFKTLTHDEDEDDDNKELFSLIRSEFPAGTSLSQQARDFRSYEYSLANNVKSLNFRFLRNGQWENSVGNNSSQLPDAVEISLSLEDSQGNIESFRTSFAVGGS